MGIYKLVKLTIEKTTDYNYFVGFVYKSIRAFRLLSQSKLKLILPGFPVLLWAGLE